jgi:hypothetical protein
MVFVKTRAYQSRAPFRLSTERVGSWFLSQTLNKRSSLFVRRFIDEEEKGFLTLALDPSKEAPKTQEDAK